MVKMRLDRQEGASSRRALSARCRTLGFILRAMGAMEGLLVKDWHD